jgi:hypothetical protein
MVPHVRHLLVVGDGIPKGMPRARPVSCVVGVKEPCPASHVVGVKDHIPYRVGRGKRTHYFLFKREANR